MPSRMYLIISHIKRSQFECLIIFTGLCEAELSLHNRVRTINSLIRPRNCWPLLHTALWETMGKIAVMKKRDFWKLRHVLVVVYAFCVFWNIVATFSAQSWNFFVFSDGLVFECSCYKSHCAVRSIPPLQTIKCGLCLAIFTVHNRVRRLRRLGHSHESRPHGAGQS